VFFRVFLVLQLNLAPTQNSTCVFRLLYFIRTSSDIFRDRYFICAFGLKYQAAKFTSSANSLSFYRSVKQKMLRKAERIKML